MKNLKKIHCALTVASSDSSGGAGVQADMLTFAANGVFATSAIAAITAQNPDEVRDIFPIPVKTFQAQMEAVFDYFAPDALKTGMLFDAEHILAVSEFVKKHSQIRAVVDPVMISTSGTRLLKQDAEDCLKKTLLPIAELITPNLDEAKALLGEDAQNLSSLARKLCQKFNANILLKGGHLQGDELEDILLLKTGEEISYKSKRIKEIDTHGSGCTLSAAIAANLAKGFSLEKSVSEAREYLISGMKNPLRVDDKLFINHSPKA